jgi:tetratricopeptide (TPR) repeat protein
MGMSVWGGIVLAVFSKENGILLPLYILAINYTLLNQDKACNQVIRRWNLVIVGLPLSALFIYLVFGFENQLSSYIVRPYSMVERILTEAVVLLDYLKSIVLPFPGDFSLFHDDFPVSSGLLLPSYTLPAVLTILTLLISALLNNSKFQVYSFSVLWFFAGHFLESTYFNLELYFEHRNYLPSIGVFFLLAYLLLRLKYIVSVKWYAYTGIALFSVLFLFNSVHQVKLWSDPLRRHLDMVEHHPDSARAITGLGNIYLSQGKFAEAQQFYQGLMASHPEDIYPRIKLMAMEGCIFGKSPSPDVWQDLHNRAASASISPFGVSQELITLSLAVSENDCQEIDVNQLIRLIVFLALNPAYGGERAILHELAARMGIVAGDASVAYHNINTAVSLAPKIPRLILKYQILIALNEFEEAEQTLNDIRGRLDENMRLKLAFADRVTQLEQELNTGID